MNPFPARTVLLALLLAAPAPVVAASSTIAITEFLNNANGSDTNREFVEFYNYGVVDVDLTGWKFEDANGPGLAFSFPSMMVPPGGFVIVTRSKTTFQNEWLGGASDPRVLGGTPFNLNNTAAETLLVRNDQGDAVWNIGYSAADANAAGAGASVFLLDATTTQTDWGTAASPGINFFTNDEFTPGYEHNSSSGSFDPSRYVSTNGDVGSPFSLPGDPLFVANLTIRSGTGTINDASSGTLNGTPFTFEGIVDDVAVFHLLGDLVLNDGDHLRGLGSAGISLRVANNVLLAPGALIEVSAFDAQSGPGGGEGGPGVGDITAIGGVGNNISGLGGTGGLPGVGGTLGSGGTPGGPGSPGLPGGGGTSSDAVSSKGGDGEDGIHAPSSAGVGVSGTAAGACVDFADICVAGSGLGAPGGGVLGGSGGSSGGGNAGNGPNGKNAPAGDEGAMGCPGEGGTGGINTGVPGPVISGGGGGGGGGAASGGGGGSAGGGGGGAGGGGGGGSCGVLSIGAPGGAGGAGGTGGDGGHGAHGAAGGDGGGGGGAMEIVANGRVIVDGVLRARGGHGAIGVLNVGNAGSNGSNGSSGFNGTNGSGCDGDGGDGGDGGKGGKGGKGGDSQGGSGGGGGGGTIKVIGSVVDASQASFNAAGGAGAENLLLLIHCDSVASGGDGGNGRVRLGHNVVGAPPAGAITGASSEFAAGPREGSPFVASAVPVPFIPDLVGGADVYGLTSLNAAQVPDVLSNAPVGALAALVRMPVGPAGYDDDYDGFDMILVVNLTGGPLADPAAGVGVMGFATPLQTRGWANQPEFGGAGPSTLTQLDAEAVWATLVPDDAMQYTLAIDGESVSATDIAPGDALYLVPGGQPCPWDLDADGSVGTSDFLSLLGMWGTNPGGPPDFDGDGDVGTSDFLDLLGHWGACP